MINGFPRSKHLNKATVIICMCFFVFGCLNNDVLEGDRLEIYPDPLNKSLTLKGKKINLGVQQSISAINQVDHGPTHQFKHASFGTALSKEWETSVLKAGSLSAPVFTKNSLFIIDGEANLISFDFTGKKVWMTDLGPNSEGRQKSQHSGGLAVHGGKIYALTGFGEIIALDVSNGTILWRRKFDSPFRGPLAIKNNKLYFVTANDLAVAMSPQGKILWSLEGPTKPTIIGKGVAPASSGNRVYLPFSAGVLKAVRSSNGSEVWSRSFDDAKKGEAKAVIGDFGGSPIIKSGKIFLVSVSGQLLKVDSQSGKIVWKAPIGSHSTPLIVGGSVFIVSSSGKLVRLSEKSGTIFWSREINSNDKKKVQYFGPTLAGEHLWMTGTDGILRKFEPESGEQVGYYKFNGPALYRPFAAHSKLFVIRRSGKLIAFK